MTRQYAVMILVEEQDVDEEDEIHACSEASEPRTLGSFGTLEEAEAFVASLQGTAESR